MKKTYSLKLTRWVLEAIVDHPNVHVTGVSQKIETILREYLKGSK
jgi:hypothetical protein